MTFHTKGKNHWHNDGRPAGFGMPLERHPLAPRLNRAWTWLAIFTVALVVIAFGQAFLRGAM